MYEEKPSYILKGARINQNICKIKLYYFSNNKLKDTFKLQIPKGELENSNAKATIINSKGEIIYSIVFPTFFLKDGYDFMPDIPRDLDSSQEKIFLENFEKTLTRELYEKHYSKKIDLFFNNCVFQAKKSSYFFDLEYCLNKDVRNEILNSKNLNCVYFPIHYGEEGSSYIGYSSKNKRAYIFAETD